MYLSEHENNFFVVESVLQTFLKRQNDVTRTSCIGAFLCADGFYLIEGYDLVAEYLKGNIDDLVIDTHHIMLKNKKEYSLMIDVQHQKADASS